MSKKELDRLKELQRRFTLRQAASEIRSRSGRAREPVMLLAQYRPTPGRETSGYGQFPGHHADPSVPPRGMWAG